MVLALNTFKVGCDKTFIPRCLELSGRLAISSERERERKREMNNRKRERTHERAKERNREREKERER